MTSVKQVIPAPNADDIEIKGLDDDDEDSGDKKQEDTILLVSKEGDKIPLKRTAAGMSKLLSDSLQNEKDVKEISMEHIESVTLKRIVDYMEYHTKNPPVEIPKPLPSSNLAEFVKDAFDLELVGWMDESQSNMYKMMLASNFLACMPLVNLSCAKFAALIKGKKPQEIRDILGVKGEYSVEEEEAIRQKFAKYIEAV